MHPSLHTPALLIRGSAPGGRYTLAPSCQRYRATRPASVCSPLPGSPYPGSVQQPPSPRLNPSSSPTNKPGLALHCDYFSPADPNCNEISGTSNSSCPPLAHLDHCRLCCLCLRSIEQGTHLRLCVLPVGFQSPSLFAVVSAHGGALHHGGPLPVVPSTSRPDKSLSRSRLRGAAAGYGHERAPKPRQRQ